MGLEQYVRKLGYDKEEEYFYKKNKELESIPFLVEIRLAVPDVVRVFNLPFNSISVF